MTLNIYGKPHCMPCKMTVRACQDNNIPYRYFDLEADPALREKIKDMGYMESPVVENPGIETWTGYQPDKIKSLSKAPKG